MLVRIARQSEVGVIGQMITKESHGRKLLIVRSAQGVAVLDAHCYHMGGQLVQGDIEDLAGNVCVVCPLHRHRIDVNTGHVLDKDLCGNVCVGTEQKQRTYRVHNDTEFIWVELPEVQTPLPSDVYNHHQSLLPTDKQQAAPQQNYGLMGPAAAPYLSSSLLTTVPTTTAAQPLQPYAGISAWPVVQQPSAIEDDNSIAEQPQLLFSQEAPPPSNQQPQFAAAPPKQPTPQQQQQQASGRLPFPVARVESAHVARRKAATAAILARAYKPPMATPTAQQQPQEQQPPVAVTAQAVGGVVRQATLFESWKMPAATTTGPDSMDMS